MKKTLLLFLLVNGLITYSGLIDTYTAKIGPSDHFNSNGVKLKDVASIIRQDRANYYKYGIIDSEDEGDSYFSNANNRQILETLLSRGSISPEAKFTIVNRNPIIKVNIYSEGYVDVIVYKENTIASPKSSSISMGTKIIDD